MARTSTRKRQRMDPETRLQKEILKLDILPRIQVRKGEFELRDVANHSDADQRDMVSLKRTQTARRRTHLEKLQGRKAITLEQRRLCEWYADQHELGYATVGCTANYCGAGGGGFGAKDLLSRYQAQYQARQNYDYARSAISPRLVKLFERVVLHDVPIAAAGDKTMGRVTRLGSTFRLAVGQLESAVGHLISFE